MLGKQIHALRVAKGWSQEEFANVSGFHRTYVGQIERGEKNLSFDNLIRVASALEVTASELLSVLDSGNVTKTAKQLVRSGRTAVKPALRSHEIQKLLLRLRHQRSALDRTLTSLEELLATPFSAGKERGARLKKPSAGKRGPLVR